MFEIRKNRMKRKAAAGEDIAMLLLDFVSVDLIEIIGTLGFDAFTIEGEHAPLDEGMILQLVRAAERYDMTPTIRLQALYPEQIGRLLDIGVQGVHYTHVRSADDVRRFIKAAKYAPEGERGFGRFSRQNCFGLADEHEAVVAANQEIYLSVAIEDVEGAENAEEICATPGLDSVGIGPSDLSASMGLAGQYDNPEFQRLYQRVKAVIAASPYGKKPQSRRVGGSANLLIAQCMQEVKAGTRTMNAFKGLDDAKMRGA